MPAITRDSRPFVTIGAVLTLFAICLPVITHAQYFGRNKVQYEDFDFQVISTEHLRVYYYPAESLVAYDMTLMAERWYARLSELFDHELQKGQPVVIYANHGDFQQTNIISGIIQQGVGGVTEGLLNRVVIPLSGIYAQNDRVTGHELTHAFHYSLLKNSKKKIFSTRQLPLWFIEGMSEYLSLGRGYPLTDMWMRDAVLHDDIPDFDKMSGDPKYFPYRWGHAFWTYVTEIRGDQVVPVLYRNVLKANWEEAFETTFQMPVDTLAAAWKTHIKDMYGPQIEGRTRPEEIGAAVPDDDADLNLSPALSPDGKYLAVLTRRDLFTIDLYVIDITTGEVIKKLASSATDSHFDALRFIDASGTWSPDGDRFAFVVFNNGDNAIAIADINSGDLVARIAPGEVGAINDLAWAPDGDHLLFCGTHGGIQDMFLYNLRDSSIEQLTDDKYTELQPSWSPDGKSIVFATDRGKGTDFKSLEFGPVRLATMDINSRNIEGLPLFDSGKQINPHYSPDGKYIYFVADVDGVSDVYRYGTQSQDIERITEVATGISGLSTLSPCFSVASQTGDLAMIVFQDADYKLRILSADSVKPVKLEKTLAHSESQETSAANSPSVVASYLDHTKPATAFDNNLKYSNYDPSLHLYYAGMSAVGASIDRFGTSLGGGATFVFTDMLGNRNLGVTAQINGGLKDLGGEVFYQNRGDRWNWGAIAGHIPHQLVQTARYIDTIVVDNQQLIVPGRVLIRQRAFVERISGVLEYPLSTNRRFEFTLGGTRISYENEIERQVFYDGQWNELESEKIDAPAALNLGQASAAYIGDYSFFGFTSPVAGRRFRIEVEPTFGSLTYLSALFDYRQYFSWRPVTFAIRGMHYGRYLEDSESNRLSPLFLGYETLVRGYSAGSITVDECTATGDTDACPEFDRLIGSRIAVVNLELRLPLFGNSEYGMVDFSYLPIELLMFLDAGVAWTSNDAPVFRLKEQSNERIPVFSAGVATRMNLFGYIVAQIYMAFPFQRPEKTTQWGFLIAPGW